MVEPVTATLWTLAVLAVLVVILARALRKAPKMPEWMAVQDEENRILMQSRTVYQRPASERFKDLGGEP
jgi:hypothetical protein